MAAETQYTANTGIQTISTANSNLDGTGTLSSAIITGSLYGTLIKTVRIKAQGNTTHGMVRLFVCQKSTTKLISEIEIPATTKSETDSTFEVVIPLFLTIQCNYVLKASTEKAESFNVIAEAQDWDYYTTSVRAETTTFAAINGIANLTTANSNLDGSGDVQTVITSSGCNICSITIQAIVSTTDGMVRLYLYDGTNTKLFMEIPVIATTKSSVAKAFNRRIVFDNGFALKNGWSIKASTEKGEAIKVIADALNWTYPA